MSKSTSTEKVTVLEGCSLLLTLHTYAHIPSRYQSEDCRGLMQKAEAMHPCAGFQSSACTSIFSEHKVFDVRQACRETLHLTTSLLTHYDSLSEKLTFFQNSLLLLYIAKNLKNWKTVTLFFWTFWRQSLFFLQPGRKHQCSTSRSSTCWWRSQVRLVARSLFFFFTLGHLRFYISHIAN